MKEVKSREEFLLEVKTLLPDNPICIELGVEKGHFSHLILQHLNPGKLYLVDPWEVGYDKNADKTYDATINHLPTAYSTEDDYRQVFGRFYPNIKKNQVIMRPDYSYNVVDDFKDDYFDFVYIDSCHLYEAVKADLSSFLPKLKLGGVMAGHDYVKYSNFGVIQAVDEFCAEYGYEMIVLNDNQYDSFDWALMKSKLD
jgi:hypothetical protein